MRHSPIPIHSPLYGFARIDGPNLFNNALASRTGIR